MREREGEGDIERERAERIVIIYIHNDTPSYNVSKPLRTFRLQSVRRKHIAVDASLLFPFLESSGHNLLTLTLPPGEFNEKE